MIERFVFDTNALVSASLLQNSTNARAFDKAQSIGDIIASTETVDEFAEVFLREKFDRYLPLEKRISIIEGLSSKVKIVNVSVKLQVCRDSKDDMVLALAIDGSASCIITGDPDLLVLHPFRGIPILNAATFLQTF